MTPDDIKTGGELSPEETAGTACGETETASEETASATQAAEETASEESASKAQAEDGAAEEGAEEDYFAPVKVSEKKKRVKRRDLPPAERRRRNIRDIIITATVCGLVLVFFGVLALCSFVGYSGNYDYIDKVNALPEDYSDFECEYDDELGYYVFSPKDGASAEDFRVLQLTDVHIGAGAFSAKKDRFALQAVAEIVTKVQPDLVIVTGDVAYPVPFQAGTFDNQREADMFGELMDKLGVYWTVVFGNHDTEAYSLHDRDDIGAYYAEKATSGEWEKCLFRVNPKDYEGLSGVGNNMILLEDESGRIVHSFVTIDSHSYTDGDYFGIAWKYDNIKDDQVRWYVKEIIRLSEESGYAVENDEYIASTVYFHIPLREYGVYWNEYKDNRYKDTANVHYMQGKAGESGEKSFPGMYNDILFESMILYNGQGTFCGHDHYNTYSLSVTETVYYEVDGEGIKVPVEITDNAKATNSASGTIRLTYGMSIDYLAYIGIAKEVVQRGGTEIKVSLDDGGIAVRQRPYVEIAESANGAWY